MALNYRGIAVSIIDGSTYDVVEFESFQSIIDWARTITRWDIHCFCIDIPANHIMSTILETGAK